LLTHLCIRNFALIENLELQLGPGLNILTGETGAGKSIIIDAVGLIIGERASQEYIRTGCDSAYVEAAFSLDNSALEIHATLEQYGIETEEDGQLLISREVMRNGKGVSRVNGRLIPISALREMGTHLIDLHGQNEHQSVMKADRHIGILDTFIGDAMLKPLQDYILLYRDLQENKKKQKELGGDVHERSRAIDLYEYQLDEIDSAKLSFDEDAVLEKERQIIANSEKLFVALETARTCLYEQDDSSSAMDLIGKALEALATAAGVDETCREYYENCQQLTYVIDDLIRDLNSYRESIDFDSERIRVIEDRLDQIFQLKRKYGNTIADILQYRDETAEKLELLKNSETLLEQLIADEKHIAVVLGEKAAQLSLLRDKGAEELSTSVERELTDLGMKNMVFQVSLMKKTAGDGIPVGTDTYAFHTRGIDVVEFLMSANPGEPVKPLIKIASGGEVSRIMLGIKAVLAFSDMIPTLIFDEIDSGIGGRAAQSVAKKLKKISAERQVLCVTHLPQIAASADIHFYITKKTIGERTGTSVTQLDQEQRVAEIARMLSGDTHSETVVRHAEEMIAYAGSMHENQNNK
jgi:DNA repair protein RecN (Recombination protein N)